MDKPKRTAARLASAFLVALAIAIVWAIVLVWVGSWTNSMEADQAYENIQIMRDGTPIISSYYFSRPTDISYRSLVGKPLDLSTGTAFYSPANLPQSPKPPGLYETAVPWNARLAGLTDYQRLPTSWYLVRDAEPIGHAYFAGYDQYSKLPVGYISRGGYSRTMPSQDQWFDLGRNHLYWSCAALMTTAPVNWESKAYASHGEGMDAEIPWWMAYLIDGDRLLSIDLRARTVRPFYESAGFISVASLMEPATETAAKPAANTETQPQSIAPAPNALPVAAVAADSESDKWHTRIAVRTADRIVILDAPPSTRKREFVIPEPLRKMSLNAYAVPSGDLLLEWTKDDDWSLHTEELAWVRPDGTIAQQKEVVLGGFEVQDEHIAAWLAVPVGPVPIGWAAILGVIAPLEMVQELKVPSVADGYAKVFDDGGLPFATVLVIGAILAWLALRLHRKYRRPAGRVWTLFVFLLGLPGFLAYLIEHRRPKLESCPQCGEVVPRDRDACAGCNTQFAAPPHVETEIFA